MNGESSCDKFRDTFVRVEVVGLSIYSEDSVEFYKYLQGKGKKRMSKNSFIEKFKCVVPVQSGHYLFLTRIKKI